MENRALYAKLNLALDFIKRFDFIFPVLIRLYLVPVFFTAGMNKYNTFDKTVAWFGNTEWGLGLPFPEVQATLAISAEIGGSILLAVGLLTRLAVIPMMFTMIMAVATVHLKNGWQVIHDAMNPFPSAHLAGAIERLDKAEKILKAHDNYDWLTEYGDFVILNNGVEWVATYFLLLLGLFFIGGGRYLSLDYWLSRKLKQSCETEAD